WRRTSAARVRRARGRQRLAVRNRCARRAVRQAQRRRHPPQRRRLARRRRARVPPGTRGNPAPARAALGPTGGLAASLELLETDAEVAAPIGSADALPSMRLTVQCPSHSELRYDLCPVRGLVAFDPHRLRATKV